MTRNIPGRKIVVPIDGSETAVRALQVALQRGAATGAQVHLLNVQLPIASGAVRSFVSQESVDRYHREEAKTALDTATALLQGSEVPCEVLWRVGHPAEVIAGYARPETGDEIVMGSRGMSLLGNLVLGSTATKVIHAAHVPVTIVK
jgi:nucleotide-binding universal stress UspA family protein